MSRHILLLLPFTDKFVILDTQKVDKHLQLQTHQHVITRSDNFVTEWKFLSPNNFGKLLPSQA